MRSFVTALIIVGGAIWATSSTGVTQSQRFGYAGGASSGGTVWFLDGNNVQNSISVGGGSVYGLTMDRSNDLLLAVCTTTGDIVSIDPRTRAVIGKLVTGLPNSPRDITVDHNGDYFVTSSTDLWKIDGVSSLVTTLTSLPSLSYGGLDVDIDDGRLLVQNWSGSLVDPLLHVTRDGKTISTLATGGDTRYGMSQDKRTGDVFSSACCGDQVGADTVWVVRRGSSAAAIYFASPVAPVGCYSLRVDRGSAANPRIILGAYHASAPRGPGGFFILDMGTRTVTRLSTINTSLYDTEVLYRRNVFSAASSRGKWAIGVNIPEDGGRAYYLVVSATGTRPGLSLPDGRHISLQPDPVTFLGLSSGFGPFLAPTAGVLPASGKMIALLDFSSFGSGLNGLPLWFIAITFDPAAQSGIQTITDPHVLVVEGM